MKEKTLTSLANICNLLNLGLETDIFCCILHKLGVKGIKESTYMASPAFALEADEPSCTSA